ncbi:MAG: hypothetical protein Q7V63_02715 [Gammaproteobacteria bacterium]|nr:hypothetical protein [Gammaproteobacteria bacterium]
MSEIEINVQKIIQVIDDCGKKLINIKLSYSDYINKITRRILSDLPSNIPQAVIFEKVINEIDVVIELRTRAREMEEVNKYAAIKEWAKLDLAIKRFIANLKDRTPDNILEQYENFQLMNESFIEAKVFEASKKDLNPMKWFLRELAENIFMAFHMELQAMPPLKKLAAKKKTVEAEVATPEDKKPSTPLEESTKSIALKLTGAEEVSAGLAMGVAEAVTSKLADDEEASTDVVMVAPATQAFPALCQSPPRAKLIRTGGAGVSTGLSAGKQERSLDPMITTPQSPPSIDEVKVAYEKVMAELNEELSKLKKQYDENHAMARKFFGQRHFGLELHKSINRNLASYQSSSAGAGSLAPSSEDFNAKLDTYQKYYVDIGISVEFYLENLEFDAEILKQIMGGASNISFSKEQEASIKDMNDSIDKQRDVLNGQYGLRVSFRDEFGNQLVEIKKSLSELEAKLKAPSPAVVPEAAVNNTASPFLAASSIKVESQKFTQAVGPAKRGGCCSKPATEEESAKMPLLS